MKHIISLFTAACMLLTSVPAFSAGNASAPITLKNLNSSVSVTGASFKNSSEAVFNVQDLHFNPEAQKKISALLEQINKAYPDFNLYVEGASQKSGFDRIFYNLGRKNAEAFIDALFESGNMSGAEYFAAKNGKIINPLEDKSVYESNLLLFAELIEDKDKISSLLFPLETKLSSLRDKHFSKRQHKLFSAYKSYLSNSEVKKKYYSYLKDEAVKSGFNINEYPNIVLYMLVSDMSASANQKKLSAQFQKLFSDLKSRLSYKQYSQILSLSNDEGDRYALMSYLYEHRETIGLDEYPELKKFVVSLALSEKINEIEFLYEENNLLSSLASSSAQSYEAQDILFLSSFLEVYKKVLTASASPYEYEYYKNNIERFKKLSARYAGKDSLNALGGYEVKARDFNETNLKRNKIFINNVFGVLSAPETAYLSEVFGVAANAGKIFERSSASQVKVIVAGGFHTSGINEILNEKQISNITFTPKLLSKHTDYSQRYVEYAKSLSQVQRNAIPLPVARGLLPSALADRLLSSVPDMQKRGLSYEDITAGIKEFMAIKEEISEIDAAYDEKSGVFSISFTENGNRVTIAEKTDIESASKEITAFSKNIPALADSIFKDIIRVFSNDILKSGLRAVLTYLSYDEEEIAAVLENISETEQSLWNKLDFGAFFDHNRGLFGKIILSLFEASAGEEDPNVQNEINGIKSEIIKLFPDETRNTEVEVIVSDSSMLISKEAYFAATMEKDPGANTLRFYIHKEFIKALDKLSRERKENIIRSLIFHEFFENYALYNENHEIYRCFGEYLKYLKSQGLNSERTTENFHGYLAADHSGEYSFANFSKRIYKTDMFERQRELNSFADGFSDIFVRRHEPVEVLSEKNDSLRYDDLIFLRVGDKEVIEKYALALKDDLKDRLPEITGKSAIAFRKTEPKHITQRVAERAVEMLSEEGIKIETVYVSQSGYMDYPSATGVSEASGGDSSRGNFNIDPQEKRKIAGKNVIFIEDTYGTGALFSGIATALNDADAEKVIPLAFFSRRDAKTENGTASEEFNNMNTMLKRYLKEQPEAAAEKIIEAALQNVSDRGEISKYLYSALFALMKEKNQAFEKIISVLNGSNNDAKAAKQKLLQDMVAIQRLYPDMAPNITPLIYALLVEESRFSKSPMLRAFNSAQKYGLFDKQRDKKQLVISKENAGLWVEKYIALLPLYAGIEGYTKIEIQMPKSVSEENVRKAIFWQQLSQSAEIFNVSVVLEYESEENLDLQVIAGYKESADKFLRTSKLNEDVAKAKEKFRGRGDISALETYNEEIRNIMIKADYLTRTVLEIEFGIEMNQNAYSIVLNGSESKGSATPDSDIYFDIIADSKETADLLSDFSFLYRYILAQSGITAYRSGSYNVSYAEEQITSLSLAAGSDVSDERAVAKFFDYEPLYDKDNKRSSAYNKYMENVSRSLQNENIIDILQNEIKHISEPYYEILENGSYSSVGKKQPFFGNLYAFAYSATEKNSMQFDYRWVLRSLEVALKDILLMNMDKFNLERPGDAGKIELSKVPQNTGKLIEFLYNNGFLKESKDGAVNKESLMNAWETIAEARIKKDAQGRHYEWTEMSEDESNSLNLIKNFVNTDVAPTARKEIRNAKEKSERSEIMRAVIRAAKTAYSKEEEDNAMRRINFYLQWAGKEITDETMAALYICDLEQSTIKMILNEIKTFISAKYGSITGIQKNVNSIKAARVLPDFTSLVNPLAVQNYMEYLASFAASSDSITAIFADRLVYSINNSEDENARANLFAFYIPLAERLGRRQIFEDMRNSFFMETNKKGYTAMRSKLEALVPSEIMGYGSFGKILDSFEAVVKERLTVDNKIHTRVKSIYSVFEKITSQRRNGNGEGQTDAEKLIRAPLDDDMKEMMQDILGLHVVVQEKDMEKARETIEKVFADSAEKSSGFSVVKEDNEEEKKSRFSYDVAKGYSSMRYKFKYREEIIGELILYTEEEYRNEHYGIITETAYKYPMPHWIYKMGASLKDFTSEDYRYPDNVFAIDVSFAHLFPKDNPPVNIKDKQFLFYSDGIELTGDFAADYRLLADKFNADTYVIVDFDDGTNGVYRLPHNATGYDLLAAIAVQNPDSKKYEYPEAQEQKYRVLRQPLTNFKTYHLKRASDGRNPFAKVIPSKAQTSLKAKLLAHAKGDGAVVQKASMNLSAEQRIIYGEYAGSRGLTLQELIYAVSQNLADIKDIEKYAAEKGKYIFEVKIKRKKDKTPEPLQEILNDASLFGISGIIAEAGYDAYKVIYSGDETEIENIISKVKNAGYEFIKPKRETPIRDAIVKKPASLPIQALGVNVAILLDMLYGGVKKLSADTFMALLTALFENGALDGTFFDENSLLLSAEADKIISDLAGIFKSEKGQVELKISDNPALISEDAFALSTLDVDENTGKITLYIHSRFLNAMEKLSDEERSFYLTQLVMHEAYEYFDIRSGKSADYEEYHKNIEVSDPNQAKLMKFAADAAGYNSAAKAEYPEIPGYSLKTAKSSVTGLPSVLLNYLNGLNNNKQEYFAEDLTENIDAYYEALAEYIERIESSSSPNGLYNEKLPVSAVLKNNTGIGELTALEDYSQGILREASVNGFTMLDLFMPSNPMAANYLLLDWSDISEAANIISQGELSAGIEERESPDINAVAKRKLGAARKVFASLNRRQLDEINAYYAENSSWIDILASAESLKYGINIDASVMAMQQMFFERQIKQISSKITAMNVSMLLKEITAANAKDLIQKWSALGISSFNIDMENVSDEILKNLREGIDESGRFVNVFIRSENQNTQSVRKISEYGFTPVISFAKLNQTDASNADFRVEIDDETLINNADIETLMKKTVNSGAKFVDYPVGLLWGDRISSEHMDEYRVPPKGSGLKQKLGLFRKILQETVPGAYSKAFETGSNFKVSESINLQPSSSVSVNGKELPLMFAAALAGNLAKQNKLDSLSGADFENIAEAFRVSLNLASVMPEASVYIKNGLNSFRNASGEEAKRIETAKLAGFIQGLSENIIISGAKVKFVSKNIACIYSRLVIERSLFESGLHPSGHKGILPVEIINGKINEVLNTMNLKEASGETVMLLNNLSARAADTGFTFDFQDTESLAAQDIQSKKAERAYAEVINVILDILIDVRVNKEDIKKTLSSVPYKAVISILSAA